MEPKAFTLSNSNLIPWLTTPCEIREAFDPNDPESKPTVKRSYVGLWDTGASASMITSRVAAELGLVPFGMEKSYHAQGVALTNTYMVNIILLNGIQVYNVKVSEGKLPQGIDMLIGMDIINLGDFVITHRNGGTIFSFQIPSTHQYDFVASLNAGVGQPKKKAKKRKR